MNYNDEKATENEKFLILNVANLDAMLQHFFSCLDNCTNFEDLKRSWKLGVKGVELQKQQSDKETIKKDLSLYNLFDREWVRDDDGTIRMFKNLEEIDNWYKMTKEDSYRYEVKEWEKAENCV